MSPRPTLGHVRKPQILAAAAEVVNERGIEATRIRDVAERAGTSAPTVVYYFGSRERLLEEALAFSEARYYEDITTRLAEHERAGERLALAVRECTGGEDMPLYMDLWLQALRGPRMGELRADGDRRWRQILAGIVRDGQASGEFSDRRDPEEVAVELAALLDGLGVQVALGDADVSPERMERLCLAYVERELGGAGAGVSGHEERGKGARGLDGAASAA